MSVADVAHAITTMCRERKNLEAVDKYYADDIVSVESMSPPGMSKETQGLEAIRGKNKWWLDNHEVHSAEANGPFIGNGQFALELKYDVTQRSSGQRMQMHEMGLYTVEGDKIVREHFFYNMGG